MIDLTKGRTRTLWVFRGTLVLFIAVLALVGTAVFRTIRRVEISNQQVVRTHDVLAAAQAILTTAVEAETAARGYLLMGDSAYLEPFERAVGTLPGALDRLESLTPDHPDYQQRLRRLRRALADMVGDLRQLVEVRRQQQTVSIYGNDSETADMIEVRMQIGSILHDEDQELERRVREDAVAMRWLQWAVVVVTSGSGALLVWVFALLARDRRREQQVSDTLRRANEALETRVWSRTIELRDANARLQSIVESAVDGIVVIDAQGRIESFNPAAERLFGYAERDVIGQNVSMLMPSPYREEHDAYLARYLKTGVHRVIGTGRQVSGRRSDGTVFPVHLAVGQAAAGGAAKFTGIVHDLTERVRMEEAMREQAALARLGEMAAVLAHEVRNPLAAVRGAIQVIGGRLPSASRDAAVISEIIARLDGLNELMTDLLLFARPLHVRRAPTDLAQLLSATSAFLAKDPNMRQVRVAVEGSAPPMLLDPELLRIVFQNLLLNAGHAMQGGGSVQLRVGCADARCRIVVSDNGPGVPPDVREKLFTPFFTTKARGTGLGLSTARRIVEAHGGTIEVHCPPDGGTTVTVDLPIEPADPA